MRQFPGVLIQRQYRVNCHREVAVELVFDRVFAAALKYDKVYLYMIDSECGAKRFVIVPKESAVYKHRSMRRRHNDGEADLIDVYDASVHAKHIRSDVFFAMGW